MITNITIKNFKKLESISFPLAQSVVIIGPNNAGKSTIFQALCLWEIGVKNFIQSYIKRDLNRQGAVTINRRDLMNSPISDARFLWRNKKVTQTIQSQTAHVKLEVELQGENNAGKSWQCNAEFVFFNTESFSCKVVSGLQDVIDLYNNDEGIHFGFLQPMSGITTIEDKLTTGSIERKLGEGRTAEVLRNICYEILYPEDANNKVASSELRWEKLKESIKSMFGADIQKPEYIRATGLMQLEYIENGIKYDISSGGRGFQQTLLLLAYMYANPGTVLLLDEPDAHLEVIRQREAFQKVNDVANEMNSQIIVASHSEVVLDEAADASKIIALIENNAFVLNTATQQQSIKYIKKSLTEIGWEKYYLARVKRHVLYLEGSTDLQMLQQFAFKLNHPSAPFLLKANVQYTADNVPSTAIANFVALNEIFPELKGLAIFDRLPNALLNNPRLPIVMWRKRELENYFANPSVLISHAKYIGNKYKKLGVEESKNAMSLIISKYTTPAYLENLTDPWWDNAKLSDDWLEIIFKEFYREINLPQDFFKRDYYQLIKGMRKESIDLEITEKLDLIYDLIAPKIEQNSVVG